MTGILDMLLQPFTAGLLDELQLTSYELSAGDWN